jgi:hypothetical protein
MLFTVAVLPQMLCAAPQDADSNPAMAKFKEDMKAAVMSGSLTIPQVKELQANAETLKSAKADQTPGAPIDLLTPYKAVSNMRAIMATVSPGTRTTLEEDLQAVIANRKPQEASATPPTAGQKLGKDVFMAVMRGKPTVAQVSQLQDSLNSLQSIKSDGGGKLQQFRALKKAKSDIEQVMNAGEFRPQDRQAVLDDLNNLGPQGGGGGMMRGRN